MYGERFSDTMWFIVARPRRISPKGIYFPGAKVMATVTTPRSASVERTTLETSISVELCLDGSGKAEFDTGVPFLEHMLDQIARHGMIDLKIVAKGDLHIDGHHTVEDIGITLGQAFYKAVGEKTGLARYGTPMCH